MGDMHLERGDPLESAGWAFLIKRGDLVHIGDCRQPSGTAEAGCFWQMALCRGTCAFGVSALQQMWNTWHTARTARVSPWYCGQNQPLGRQTLSVCCLDCQGPLVYRSCSTEGLIAARWVPQTKEWSVYQRTAVGASREYARPNKLKGFYTFPQDIRDMQANKRHGHLERALALVIQNNPHFAHKVLPPVRANVVDV
ncbi:hypothetical protein DL89DRAFT_108761 [Linderina pennispora]|uniref:Uncharacterized protein n=1 Tax=Linderina pennispora TaxID=61395 RepID=A0A1Y1WG67_9FUNG|nr:uncharacterized protein DL89DRAFT_108761 [Linderina pennispora]ORX72134.1 hypothetical protein DL89DRAFT_108761 [Linderina pennispora]